MFPPIIQKKASQASPLQLLLQLISALHSETCPPFLPHRIANHLCSPLTRQQLNEQLMAATRGRTPTQKELGDMVRTFSVPTGDVSAFWTAWLEEVVCFNEDDWGRNWELSYATWRALYTIYGKEDGRLYAVLFGRLSVALVECGKWQETPAQRAAALEKPIFTLRSALSLALRDTSPLPPARHDACFLLANAQFRYYLTLKSYQAAVDGLLTSLSAHLPSLTAIYDAPGMGKMRCHSMATQVEFRYHLGKYRLGLRRIPEAHANLLLAFELCSIRSVNCRRILIPLLATSLLIGTLPSPQLLSAFSMNGLFLPLVQGIKNGDLRSWRLGLGLTPSGELGDEERWGFWRKFGVLGVLKEKGEVLVWRSLLRKTFLLHRRSLKETDKLHMFPIAKFRKALAWASGDSWLELADAEAICITLLDQGYIRAYIDHATSTLVFSKEAHMGFPPIARVRARTGP